MKILIASGIYPPDIGGPATYSKLLFGELTRRDLPVSVLSFGAVRFLPKGIRHIVFFLKLLRRCIHTDIVFAQDTVSVGLPSLLVSKILRKTFVLRVPGDYAWEQATQRFKVADKIDDFQSKKYGMMVELLRSIQKFTVNGADVVITPSMYFKNLVSNWVQDKSKVYCIYNGIDLSGIAQTVGGYEPKTIISAGRLVPWKGFPALIYSLQSLPEWKLYIAGDGPMKNELEQVSVTAGVSDRVFFLGQISQDNLIKKIQKSDIFVLNTHFESFSFQIVEAMASGTPVVATNIGNISEIIKNNVDGILVSPDDISAITLACTRLSSDITFRQFIVTSARKKSEQFSVKKTVDRLLSLIYSKTKKI